MSTPLQKLVSPHALVASTLMSAETDTALGERQLWLYLTNEASIEITYESAGLAPTDAFWSVTYHNSEAEFDATNVDIVERLTLATSASFAKAVEAAMSLLDTLDTVAFDTDDNDDSALWRIDDVDADDLVHAYDRYIQAANDNDAHASGWRPVSLAEFADTEYLNVWCEADFDEREDCFDYLNAE